MIAESKSHQAKLELETVVSLLKRIGPDGQALFGSITNKRKKNCKAVWY